MNNGPYIHSKMNTRKIILYYIFALIPLILYGFYKNGILVFLAGKTSFIGLMNPVIYPFLGYVIGLLCEFFYLKLSKNDQNWKEDIFYSFIPLYTTLIGMVIPTNINALLYFFLLFLFFFGVKWISFLKKINQIALFCLLLFGGLYVTGGLQFLNSLEETKEYSFQLLDLLFGRNIGGICATNIVFVLIGYFFLSLFGFYKKDIPIYILIIYFLLSLIFGLSSHQFLSYMTNFLSNSLIFVSVFCATDSVSSPYTKLGRLTYGVLIGILGFFIGLFIDKTLAIFLAIFIISIFSSTFDNFFLKLSK